MQVKLAVEYVARFFFASVLFVDKSRDGDQIGAKFHCADQFEHLANYTLTDLWRAHNGQQTLEFTWYSRAGNGFRIESSPHTQAFAIFLDYKTALYNQICRP